MTKHKIEWLNRPGTKGESWNPITGCTPISEGCANCYARRMAKRLAGRCGYPEAPHEFDVTLHPDRLDKPLHWRKPRMVFICSMSDFFHPAIPFEFQLAILRIIGQCPQHTFVILTKRTGQLEMWEYACGWHPYPNLWLGVSVENQARADERIPILLQIPAAVRFVSVEPMLGRVDLTMIPSGNEEYPLLNALSGLRRRPVIGTYCSFDEDAYFAGETPGLDQVICGFETGTGARPTYVGHALYLLAQCRAANVPFFWKRGGPGQEIPSSLIVREWSGV